MSPGCIEMGFLEAYNKGDKSTNEALAIKYLVGDLLVKNLKGSDKMTDLYAFDAESMMPTQFVPSMFYTFMYVSKKMSAIGNDNFYDMVPLILCVNFDGKVIQGINFNLLPNNVRAAALDKITESYSPYYQQLNPNKPINNDFGSILINPKYRRVFFDALSDMSGLNINMAFRTYDITCVMKPRMIEYDMWKYIPFLSFKDAVRGVNLANLQRNLLKANRR